FYDYFDELRAQVRRCLGGHLGRKAGVFPGETAIGVSALLSLFCDVAAQNVPLSDVDEYGYPMLWPLLLKYVERHCNKWNAYYRTAKRGAAETSLDADPVDYRADAGESALAEACEALYARLTEAEQKVLEGRLRGETLKEIARGINR